MDHKPLYQIVEWDRDFEVSQTRRTAKTAGAKHHWVAIPNKHDGKGYLRVASQKNGVEIFAAWCLMVQLASKMPIRGVLADKDGPLTLEDMAIKTRMPLAIFEQAAEYLTRQEIGWLRVCDYHSERTLSTLRAQSERDVSYMTEQNMTEHDIIFTSGKPKHKKKQSTESEPQSITIAARAWAIVVKRLNDQDLSEGETIKTPEIQAAIKSIGGSKYLSSLDVKYLPSIKKDFIAAYNQASKQ